jgi:hypothetical protein
VRAIMTTEISRFQDAYASMKVAVFEPFITKWISGWTIRLIAENLAWRAAQSPVIQLHESFSTAAAVASASKFSNTPSAEELQGIEVSPVNGTGYYYDKIGNLFPADDVKGLSLSKFPDAKVVGNVVYPEGITNVHKKADGKGSAAIGALNVSSMMGNQIRLVDESFDIHSERNKVSDMMWTAVREALASGKSVADRLRTDLRQKKSQIPSDLVVKYQELEIIEVIVSLIWRRTIVQTSCRHRKARCEPLSPSQAHRSTTKSGGMWTIRLPEATMPS